MSIGKVLALIAGLCVRKRLGAGDANKVLITDEHGDVKAAGYASVDPQACLVIEDGRMYCVVESED